MRIVEHSPLGTNAPGFADLGKYFAEMWKEAEARREEWGCEFYPPEPFD